MGKSQFATGFFVGAGVLAAIVVAGMAMGLLKGR